MHPEKHVFNNVISIDNAILAFHKASAGKHYRMEFLNFERNLIPNLYSLIHDIEIGIYHPFNYDHFTVYDPKERDIMKLPGRDRVAQHMWNNVAVLIFDNKFIYHSYACRSNKGAHLASKNLSKIIYNECVLNNKRMYAIKGDISSYFKSIDHNILINYIQNFVVDERYLNLTWEFITNNGYQQGLANYGVGIPVGNLSSQLFANIYGDILDKYIVNILGIKYYMRYMDDFIILDDNHGRLSYILSQISEFIFYNMKMTLNPKTTILHVNQGFDFIGFRFYEDHVRPRKSNMIKLDNFINKYYPDIIENDFYYKQSFMSRIGHMKNCDSYQYIQDKMEFLKNKS